MTIAQGTFVRLRQDPGRAGILLEGEKYVAGKLMVEVKLADGQVRWLPQSALEPVPSTAESLSDRGAVVASATVSSSRELSGRCRRARHCRLSRGLDKTYRRCDLLDGQPRHPSNTLRSHEPGKLGRRAEQRFGCSVCRLLVSAPAAMTPTGTFEAALPPNRHQVNPYQGGGRWLIGFRSG